MNTLKLTISFTSILLLLLFCGDNKTSKQSVAPIYHYQVVEKVKQKKVKPVIILNIRGYNSFSEEWKQKEEQMFNIGNKCFAICSCKELVDGTTVKVGTNSGMLAFSADSSRKLRIVSKDRNLMDDILKYNTNYDILNNGGQFDVDSKVQLSNVDLDGDGKNELVVTIGAPNTGLGIVSFIFTSELKYAGKVDGWDYMFLNKHRHIIAPHSALRWYDYYSYRNGEIKNLGEVDIDISQQPSINQKKAENRLYNELRNTK